MNLKPVTLSDEYLVALESGGLPHPQITVNIGGTDILVDTEIADIVLILNTFSSNIYTISSCQGFPAREGRSEWSAHVALRTPSNDWRVLAEFGFETLKPLIESETCNVWSELILSNESEPTLWLMFNCEVIEAIYLELYLCKVSGEPSAAKEQSPPRSLQTQTE